MLYERGTQHRDSDVQKQHEIRLGYRRWIDCSFVYLTVN